MRVPPDSSLRRVLGRPLCTRIRSRWLADWFRDQVGRLAEAEVPVHPFAIEVAESQDAPEPFEGHPANALLIDAEVPFRIGPTIAEYRDARSGVRLDLGPRGAVIRCWGVPRMAAAGPDPTAQFWRAVHVVFSEALRASDLLPFHAAVVVRHGRATALLGTSGAGKSTTSLRAVNTRRWGILAEDLAWLDPHTLILHGQDSGIRLWPESVQRFAPDLAEEHWQTDARGKRFLPWNALDLTLHTSAPLDTVLVLSRLGPGQERVAAREALKTLWQATGVPLIPAVRDRVATTLPALLDRIRFRRHMLGQPLESPR